MCATLSCIMFTFMHCTCVRHFGCETDTLVVRHDLCLMCILLSCVLAHSTFASALYSVVLEPFVYILSYSTHIF